MGTRPLNKGTNRPITLFTVKLFIQLMYNKNDHLAKCSIFCQIVDVFFRLYNPFPPKTQDALYICYIFGDIYLSKGHLGSRGESI